MSFRLSNWLTSKINRGTLHRRQSIKNKFKIKDYIEFINHIQPTRLRVLHRFLAIYIQPMICIRELIDVGEALPILIPIFLALQWWLILYALSVSLFWFRLQWSSSTKMTYNSLYRCFEMLSSPARPGFPRKSRFLQQRENPDVFKFFFDPP